MPSPAHGPEICTHFHTLAYFPQLAVPSSFFSPSSKPVKNSLEDSTFPWQGECLIVFWFTHSCLIFQPSINFLKVGIYVSHFFFRASYYSASSSLPTISYTKLESNTVFKAPTTICRHYLIWFSCRYHKEDTISLPIASSSKLFSQSSKM